MAAALRPCPSGLVVGARRLSSSSSSSPSSLRIIRPLCSISLLNLNTSAGRTTAPRLRHRQAIRAQNGAADWTVDPDPDDGKPVTEEEFNKFREELKKRCELDKDMPFREDIEKIDEYLEKMSSWNKSIFHMKATALSCYLCMILTKGVKLASRIMDTATFRLDKQDEISLHTTKQTLKAYVSIFVSLAEAAYHRRFNVKSVFSLLGAFKGVAAVSHILLQDTLSSGNYGQESLSKYKAHDLDNDWREFEQKVNDLEDKFRAVSHSTKAYELVRPTMVDAMILTIFFISKMVGIRLTVLGKLPGARPRRSTIPRDDAEPNASETGSDST